MPSVWIERRSTRSGAARFRVMFRVGGRESRARYGGSFVTKAEAKTRKAWVSGELAAMRVPDLAALAERPAAPTFAEMAARWQASRVDVREGTRVQHAVALARALPLLGDRAVDEISPADIADLVAVLNEDGKKRETIRKSLTAAAMVLDFAGVTPNPARDRIQVKLPLEEPEEPSPPSADDVEAAAWMLTPTYRLAVVMLDWTGARIGELVGATVGDLDERKRGWLVRAAVSKTRKPRWVELPDDLFEAILERLPAREDRDLSAPLLAGVNADRIRMAIARGCRDAGVPRFGPHSLRHRRISLLHVQGVSWAEIGARVGQRDLSTTANTYTHVLVDTREIDRSKLLDPSGAHAHDQGVPSPVPPPSGIRA